MFFQERHKTGLFVSYDLLREDAIKKARSLNIPQVVLKLVRMGYKVYAPNGAGVGRRYAKSCQRFLTKVVEFSAVHHFSKTQLSTANLIHV
jgi:hypothetical protein